MKYIWILLLLISLPICHAEEIIVLTKMPVAEFTLPEGKVLKNAYAWKRSSEGIMIIHDDGSLFLNFELLPTEWKKAYGLLPDDAENPDTNKSGLTKEEQELLGEVYMAKEELDDYLKKQEQQKLDRLIAENLKKLRKIPASTIRYFSTENYDRSVDETLLVVCVYANLLKGERNSSQRFLKLLDKSFPDATERVDDVFPTCLTCDGKKSIKRDCPSCGGSGDCKKCEGEGEVASGFGEEKLDCNRCKATGKCSACRGEGEQSRQCKSCRGRGRTLQRELCEEKLAEAIAVIKEHYETATAE